MFNYILFFLNLSGQVENILYTTRTWCNVQERGDCFSCTQGGRCSL